MIDTERKNILTPGSPIVAPDMGDNFSIKSEHLKIIRDNCFDGVLKSDPHEHVLEFTEFCKMFSYGAGSSEGVKLMLFPWSLTGEAKFWLKELEPNSITTWDQLRELFVRRFFPHELSRVIYANILTFKQSENETLIEAWVRLKEMLRECHGHNVSRDEQVQIFYYGLNRESQHDLDIAGGGSFLYKTSKEVFKIMEDWKEKSVAKAHVKNYRRLQETVTQVGIGDKK